jgi:Protein of unknown function (DUF2817)
LKGAAGETLTVDVLRIGEPSASRWLIITSGTHGIEGFCGSAIQSAWLDARLDCTLPADVAVLLVHALNPYGFSWLRRTDAENIDLNRNFLDFDQPRRANPAYEEIHTALVPPDWDGTARASADADLRRYIDKRGMRTLQAAVFGGQYDHPDGLVYGGRHPAWSNVLWRQLLRSYAHAAEIVAVLDVHSGLGAPGACELISGARAGTIEREAAHAWFGPGLVFPGSTSTAPAASGYMGDSLAQELPRAVGALVVAEFGTVSIDAIFDVLRADNWIHAHDQPESSLWRRTKREMYDAFVRPDAAWKTAIIDQGLGLARQLTAALASARAVDFEP